MKKIFFLLFFFSIFLSGNSVLGYEDERILEFKSDITVETDTSIQIFESITFRPSLEISRHGLEWQIPYEYSVFSFKRPTLLEINSVKYFPLSNPSLITEDLYSRSDKNGWAVLRIGDPNSYISEPYVYEIKYTLKYSGISYFDAWDEIYLNIIGPGWNIPIENASAKLTLPENITDIVCYTGSDGSTNQNCNIKVSENIVEVSPQNILQPYEGYTVAIKQPKGTFEDTRKEQMMNILISNIGIFLPIPIGIFLFGFLRNLVRSPKLPIIPEYKPIEQLDALSGSSLYKGTFFVSKNISALLIEMAIKGYYKIKEYEKKKYEFVKLEKSIKNLPNHIQVVLDGIFAYGDIVPISKLTNFYIASNQGYIHSKGYLKDIGYISKSRSRNKNISIFLTFFGIFILFSVGPFFAYNSAIGTFIGILISIILLLFFLFSLDIRSEEGNKAYYSLLGLKKYIETAEIDRIKFHNDPNKGIEIFENLLPYAMIFGLEKKWAKQFEDIYVQPPQWYEGNFDTFNTIYLMNSINTFNSGVSTHTVSPNSYGSSGGYRSGGWSSGGSGFGGGSSGGGGGGSGGGGW